jgi:hypothetical protein
MITNTISIGCGGAGSPGSGGSGGFSGGLVIDKTGHVSAASAVPEPHFLLLQFAGLLGLVFIRRVWTTYRISGAPAGHTAAPSLWRAGAVEPAVRQAADQR